MNPIDDATIIKASKRKFKKHVTYLVSVKPYASVPYEKSFFHKIISDSIHLNHTHYILYIHDTYLTIQSKTHVFEPVKVTLDNKLWIEIYKVFKIEGISDNTEDVKPV